MDKFEELYQKLLEAYSPANLNRITRNLIELYKAKNYGSIREIANKVSRYIPIDEEQDARCFSKLAVLYHPDKGHVINKKLKQHYAEKSFEALESYSHILLLDSIEYAHVSPPDESIDYAPEYDWDDLDLEGFTIFSEDDNHDLDIEIEYDEHERSFYNAVKYRQYGDLTIEFPPHYLEDFDNYEMSECGIEILDGIEYCIHAKIIDLSGNMISDISDLGSLYNLEELYLSNNEISYIDILNNLPRLNILDISGNQVDDVSPLFGLMNLEYVNVVDNPVPMNQIERLKNKGVVVVF